MGNYLLILCVIFFHLAVFYGLGVLLAGVLRLEDFSVTQTLTAGFLLYFALFECVALPSTLLHVPLSALTKVWTLILAALVLFSLLAFWRPCLIHLKKLPDILREHSFLLALLFLAVIWQMLCAVLYQDASADAAYYVGTASTSVYTDTLSRFDPYTGEKLAKFSSRYVFSCYPLHNAYISRLFGIHPLIQCKVVMSGLNVFLCNLLYYQLGRLLFPKSRRQAGGFVLFVFLINLMSNTLYTPGTFLFTRAYEGKALLANFSVFFLFYCALWLLREPNRKAPWVFLFIGNLASVTFSSSAMILPVALGGLFLPLLLWNKRPRQLLFPAVCLIPSIFLFLAYFLAKTGFFPLTA